MQTQKNSLLFYLCNFLTALLLFSPLQWENWLWGFQLAWFWINLNFVLAIFSVYCLPNIHFKYKFCLAALFCSIATYSSAQGIFSWFALIPLLFFTRKKIKERLIIVGIWLTLSSLCIGLYFVGYQKPSAHPDTLFVLEQPARALTYFFSLVGYSITGSFGIDILLALKIGIFLVSVFICFNIYSLFKYNSTFLENSLPWISLGWFSILFCLATTVGRAGFGISQAFSSRYTSITILLVIACVQLIRLLIDEYYGWIKNIIIENFFFVFY